jgi:hypothetical protein
MTAHLNTNWASGAFAARTLAVPCQPTLWEELVFKAGLENRPDLWVYDAKLVKFAKQNRNKRYIPESFLSQLGLEVLLSD